MFDYKKVVPIFFALFSVPAVNAVISQIEVWSDGIHYRYFLKDTHTDYIDGRVSVVQQRDMLSILQQRLSDAFLLAEDIFCYDGADGKIRSFYENEMAKDIETVVWIQQVKRGLDPERIQGSMQLMNGSALSPLYCLILQSRKLGISSYNVECAQVLEGYEHGTYGFTLEDLRSDLERHLQELTECKKLSGYYQFLSSKFEEAMQLAMGSNQDEFIQKVEKTRQLLVDAKILLKLSEWCNITHGFICAGGAHIENVKGNLSSMGYKHIKTMGVPDDYFAAAENENCCEYMLKNSLDLRKTFTQIFQEQQPRSVMRRWVIPMLATTVAAAVGVAAWVYLRK